MDKKSQLPTLRTFPQFCERHPWCTEGGLRWLRFNCHENGFERAFRTLGRRVLIDEEAFFECLEEQQ